MINKIVPSTLEAVAGIPDGATIMVGSFGGAGVPNALLAALLEQGAKDLVLVSNNAGKGEDGVVQLLKAGRIRKVICSFPRQKDSQVFDNLYREGKVEMELLPQGTLAERIRAAGAGVEAFYTPTGFATELTDGKETRRIFGRDCVLEYAIHADYSLTVAHKADRWGNLVYNKTARNFSPIMCSAAKCSIVQTEEIVELGALDPESVATPCCFVHRVVLVPRK